MERDVLRKVQMAQLEIAKEIKRVCDENDIKYFLCFGTMLGAVRHKGFIPWDDDMDLGMMRSEYEKFCRIAPEKLKPEYVLQTWDNDPAYALPFAKVRKRNTLYLEGKAARLKENGFYVDIFPYDYALESKEDQQKLTNELLNLFRVKLMKSGYTPWMDNGSIIWKKRIGYLAYQLKAMLTTNEAIIEKYDALAKSVPETGIVYGQEGLQKLTFVKKEWCEELTDFEFEGERFAGPKDYHAFLTNNYGDYMQLPPEDERENRHQIVELDFGE